MDLEDQAGEYSEILHDIVWVCLSMLSMTGSPLETDEDGASDHHRAGFRVSDRLSTHELNRLFVSTLYPLLIAPRLNILNHTQLSMLSMEASKSRIAFGLPEIYFPKRL